MRVIDHRRRELQKKKQRRPKKSKLLLALVFAVLVAGVLVYQTRVTESPDKQAESSTALNQNLQKTAKTGKLKTFTAEQFKELYNNFSYPNTAAINESTPITGNEVADQRIKQIAISRGYQKRSAPVTNAFIDIGDGFKLQQRAAQPWLDLKAAAKKDGLNFGLTDAYRAADDQKQIFTQRLKATGVPVEGIASGAYDAQVSQVLRMTAIPGYSRHHTGYTVDIACKNQPATAFEYTACFKWLSANNYENAKIHGWIPGYPEGATDQGPDPEAWEYVWVGTDAVYD